ncbi:ribosomal maturation YjgA family protein [Sphingomonas immobilis]|uniref:DUF2809 domain-containing protein n=1 Tax=Sphingomonas immobilis TaxID=3063997 RepID=A0ABT9A224_9SPHN|nr:DUF2809 domain-containing protein [Sphingomonas sp. CA1-15]MDO7843305.1 DUF2809 domain-containing protein [Sphingomonas sp. CA1-15]
MIFRPFYAAAALLVFAIEVAIALFVDDGFVRPYLGDSLAVVLVYLAIRACIRLGVTPAVLAAVAIAFAVEVSQYFHLVRLLGLEWSAVARCVLGTGFDPQDFAAYLAGGALAFAGERLTSSRSRARRSRRPARAASCAPRRSGRACGK